MTHHFKVSSQKDHSSKNVMVKIYKHWNVFCISVRTKLSKTTQIMFNKI